MTSSYYYHWPDIKIDRWMGSAGRPTIMPIAMFNLGRHSRAPLAAISHSFRLASVHRKFKLESRLAAQRPASERHVVQRYVVSVATDDHDGPNTKAISVYMLGLNIFRMVWRESADVVWLLAFL